MPDHDIDSETKYLAVRAPEYSAARAVAERTSASCTLGIHSWLPGQDVPSRSGSAVAQKLLLDIMLIL